MNDMEAYGDGYMEPEEEWEREGLLDPAWEKQQKKVSVCLFIIYYLAIPYHIGKLPSYGVYLIYLH